MVYGLVSIGMKSPQTWVPAAFCLVVGRDLNLRPLGYEHCDARLWHLGRSRVIALASGNPVRYLVPEPPRLRYLALSRRVRFTNRFTETVLDVRLRTWIARRASIPRTTASSSRR